MVNRQPHDATARWSSIDVDADGVPIHVHRTGPTDGPALVLAHGLGDSGRCWWRVAQMFDEMFDVIMIDARNHGDSGTGGGGAERLAADVDVVVSALDLDRPALMGHSVGARTVAEYVAAFPGSCSRLVLLDPPWTIEQEADGTVPAERREVIRAWLASFADMSNDELMELGRQQHPSWPREEFAAWVASKRQVRPEAADTLSGDGWGATVAALDCPTLLVHGDPGTDAIVTSAVVERAVDLNQRVRAARIKGAGHNIHREQFDRAMSVVRTFLAPPVIR